MSEPRFGWAAILDVLGLSSGDKLTYIALLAHRNELTGQCNPSLGTLARRLSVDRVTITRRLSHLERAGAIRRVRHGHQRRPADYELLIWADSSLPPPGTRMPLVAQVQLVTLLQPALVTSVHPP